MKGGKGPTNVLEDSHETLLLWAPLARTRGRARRTSHVVIVVTIVCPDVGAALASHPMLISVEHWNLHRQHCKADVELMSISD